LVCAPGRWQRGILVAFTAENLEQDIRQVGEPIARALGVEILEVQSTGRPANLFIRLILDKRGGVGIEDCEQFHQSLRRTWEVIHPDRSMYRFEVSSPGLDRPLKDQKDFQRVVGELIRVTLRIPMNTHSVIVARLVTVTDGGIYLVDDRGKHPQEIHVAWDDIAKAKLEIIF
jgi:ribosome maturation factor RimP